LSNAPDSVAEPLSGGRQIKSALPKSRTKPEKNNFMGDSGKSQSEFDSGDHLEFAS